MTVKYKTVITKAGAEKLAAATLPNGRKVNFAAMAVGDGGGKLPEPNASQTKLVNEVWRHALNKISQDKKHKNYIVAELVIPPETGGFWLREMGLYDDTGVLIAVGNMAESYKPELAEGSGRAQTLRMVIMVSDIDTVELSIDTTLVMATQDYVDDKLAEHEQSRRHPDATLYEKGFTQLSSATDSTSEALAATPNAVKAAYDLAKGKYTAQDASTAQKGIVQLSSATDSVSETVAATPKAVKAAYDLASGKYTAQDGTTKQKGIVQLSSATDSTSETLAATPGAVKAANDNANGRVPSTRKINGHELTDDFSITAQDIFNGQAVGIGNAADLNSYTTPGLYYQPANAQAQTGSNYPYIAAGSLEVIKHAGITQIYRIYNNSKSYIRTLYGGTWTAWAQQYDSANKPTPADIAAVAKAGDAMSGTLIQDSVTQGAYNYTALSTGTTGGKNYLRKFRGGSGDVIWHETVQGSVYRLASGNTDAQEEFSIATTGVLARGNITSLGAIISGNVKSFTFSSSNTSTLAGRINLWGNASRPTVIEFGDSAGYHFYSQRNTSGAITFSFNGVASFSGITLGDYGNFDARYYTKAQSDAGYMPRTGAYTKEESKARYLTDTRLGARNYRLMTKGTMFEIAGNIISGLQIEGEVDGNGDYIVMRPLQKLLNGTWYTVAQV